jgi:hypothetical protein
LRNRFIVGAGDTYSVNQTGGTADAIVVTHNHTATSVVTDPGHNHTFTSYNVGGTASAFAGPSSQRYDYGNDPGQPVSGGTNVSNTTGITVATTNTSAGTSGTNANLPPYFALCYIMKS